MYKIGIECENLEDPKSRWGVGAVTLNLLKEYAANPEWRGKYKFYLYFKKNIPDDEVLKDSIFVKRVLGFPSFNIFYHILMPLRAMADGLDWMFFPAYMLPPLYLRKSVVMLTNDVFYEYKSGNLPFRYRLAYRLFTNWAAIKSTKILAISEFSKKELVKLYGIDPSRIFVSYLGVGESVSKIGNWRLEIGNYILYVGQMFPRRHARETILAFEKIASEFPGLKLIMVGRDKYSPLVIEKLIKEMNQKLGSERIIHYDYIEKRQEIDKLYAGAKALVYVSDNEAFGLPPVEALSFGAPPLVIDNDLSREIFGEYAFFSKDAEVKNIADAIRITLTDKDKIEKIKTSGPEFARKYSWHNFAGKFFKELK